MQNIVAGPEDSTQYRRWEHDVGKTLTPLFQRCQKLRQGGKKYVAALSDFAAQQREFGDCLEEFGQEMMGLTDECGAENMTNLAGIFQQHADFTELLKTWVELTVTNHLRDKWLRGILQEARDAKQVSEQRRNEYDAARKKLQGRNTQSSVREIFHFSTMDRVQSETINAEAAAFEARCNALRTFHELEGCKRYDFLRMYAENAKKHLRYHDQQVKALKVMEQDIASSSGISQAWKAEHDDRMADVEKHIDEALARFRSRDADSFSEPPRGRSGSISVLSDGTDGTEPPITDDGRSQQGGALEAQGELSGTSIVKEGYLNKQPSNGIRRAWQRRFFKLDSAGNFYYENGEGGSFRDRVTNFRRGQEGTVMSLATANVKPGIEDADVNRAMRYCFRVKSRDRTFNLQAASDEEMNSWIRCLEDMTHRLLSGPDVERHVNPPPQQRRNNHSRDSSLSTAIAEDFTVIPFPAPESPAEARENPRENRHWRNISLTNLPAPRNSIGAQAGAQEQANQRPALPTTPRMAIPEPSRRGSERLEPHHRHTRSLESSPQRGPVDFGPLPRRPVAPEYPAIRRPPEGPTNAVVRRLRAVPGNDLCADCGAPNPDWASLNLGVLICKTCSGTHRHLGTHISKVQSLTLDTKVWEGPALDMMAELGNTMANAVYEEKLTKSYLTKSPLQGSAAGVSFTGEEDLASHLANNTLHQPAKPTEVSSPEEREKFITAKYEKLAYVVQKTSVIQMALLAAFRRGSLEMTLQAVARGADLSAPLNIQYSDAIMAEVDQICPPKHVEDALHMDAVGIPPIMAACKAGNKSIMEYLFLNGADKTSVDLEGRSLLHYAAVFGNPELVLYFVKRGLDRNIKDKDGQTAYDIAKRLAVLEPLAIGALDPNAQAMPKV